MLASLFLLANLGFITGVLLASFSVSKYFLVFSIFLKPRRVKTIFIFLIFIFLGSWRYEIYQAKKVTVDLSKYNNQKVILQGRVSEEVDPGGNYQKIILSVNLINNQPTNGLVLINLAKYPEYHYGDILKVSGKLETPNNWSEFRYDRYLARYDIYSIMAWPKVEFIRSSIDTYKYLLNFKAKIYLLINQALPEPEAGLANALLLGYKNTLDKTEKDNFSCVGLSHVIAISGSHLTLLSVLAFNFLLALGLSSRKIFRPVTIFIWLYTILTGLQTSALRSAIMISLVLWGKKNGRSDAGGRLLFITAAIMLFFNPLLLRDDLGFQLSFLAMIALIYFQPLGEKILGQGSIKSIISLTIVSQLITWPIAAYNFGLISVIAPLANVIVVWLFAWLLPALLAASALSLIMPTLKVLWFAPSYFMLTYVVKISAWLASWSGACFNRPITITMVISYYLWLMIIYFILRKYLKK